MLAAGDDAMTRRRLISAAGAGGLAVLLGACTASTERRVRPTPPTAVLHSDDEALLRAATADEEDLLGYCAAVLSEHRGLATVAGPMRQRQRQHVDTFRSALRRQDFANSPLKAHGPARASSALAELLRLAAAAQHHRFSDCLDAESGRLARLLASTSASHAVTVDVLRAAQ